MVANRNRAQNVEQLTSEILPKVYGAIGCALWYHFSELKPDDRSEAIFQIFQESERLWQDCVNKGYSLADRCEELTGIEVKYMGQRTQESEDL